MEIRRAGLTEACVSQPIRADWVAHANILSQTEKGGVVNSHTYLLPLQPHRCSCKINITGMD